MNRTLWFAAASFVALGLTAFIGCGQQATDPTLELKISPRQIEADGTTTTLTVTATDAKGQPGTGDVTITAKAGSIDGGGPSATVTLSGGTASVTFACDASKDDQCSGLIKITADWNGVLAASTVSLPGSPVEDAGHGNDMDAGNMVSGDGGTISLKASKGEIFLEVGDYADLTATMKSADGQPLANQQISFSTTAGELVAGTGTGSSTATATTDATGVAKVQLHESNGMAPTVASVTASHELTGAIASVNVSFLDVQQASWVSTTCGGSACSVMGIKTSGVNEQAQVTFKVVDASNNPASGIAVNFDIANPPGGVYDATSNPGGMQWQKTGTTNAKGEVTINVSAGTEIGVFTVKATVIPGRVEAQSQSIGIRGAKASNNGFGFQCSPVNNSAYISPNPPALITVNCKIGLADRYNNPVGTGTSVFFKTEAGSVPNSVPTKAFNPNMPSSSDEGTGTIVFDTSKGSWPAVDVSPLAADTAQWPYPRDAEPSVQVGGVTRNPRDGLVTIIAYLKGEEHFYDDNKDGIHQPNERFIDQGEAFVDANDNGVWDPNETYIDDSPKNNKYDGPNGVWDADTTIWTETHILFTGAADPTVAYIMPDPYSSLCGCASGTCGVPKGGVVTVDAFLPDQNLNRMKAGATFTASHLATKGSVAFKGGAAYLDSFGFGIERRLIDAASSQDCTSASPICEWKTLFYGWSYGYAGPVEIKGANTSDMSVCAPDVLTVEGTIQSIKTAVTATGAMN